MWQQAVGLLHQLSRVAKGIRTKLARYRENAKGYGPLFADLQSIIYEQARVDNRVARHKLDEKQKLDDERARIRPG
jgi:hypothetical protein